MQEDAGKRRALNHLLAQHGEDLLAALGCRFRRDGQSLRSACPVHGGDNPTAFQFYRDEPVPGLWTCYSRNCHQQYRRHPLGLIGAVCGLKEWQSCQWACQLLGVAWQDIEPLSLDSSHFFVQTIDRFFPGVSAAGEESLEVVWQRLHIPSPYFLQRGWSASVLERFAVGDCLTEGKRFCHRAVVPVLGERGVLGYTARSHFERCPHCQKHHASAASCPGQAKWLNSPGLPRGEYLYNYHQALAWLKKRGETTLWLVESPGDLWRLVEQGVENVVALLGCHLTDRQQVLLEQSPALEIILALNQDQAGQTATQVLGRQLGRLFRLRYLQLPAGCKDLGDWQDGPASLGKGKLVGRPC